MCQRRTIHNGEGLVNGGNINGYEGKKPDPVVAVDVGGNSMSANERVDEEEESDDDEDEGRS